MKMTSFLYSANTFDYTCATSAAVELKCLLTTTSIGVARGAVGTGAPPGRENDFGVIYRGTLYVHPRQRKKVNF